MPDELKYDLEYRPKSYWIAEATKARLARVTGQARRELVRALLDEGFVLPADDPMAAESLSKRRRRVFGLGHPAMMGGEYLPKLPRDEVEVARLVLASTTMDVISLRARRGKDRIRYRMVDEYWDEGSRYMVQTRSSREPLSFKDLVELLDHARLFVGEEELDGSPRGLIELTASEDPKGAFDFVDVSSSFYPQLQPWYREAATEMELEYNFDYMVELLTEAEGADEFRDEVPALAVFLPLARKAIRLAAAGVTGDAWEKAVRRNAKKSTLSLATLRKLIEAVPLSPRRNLESGVASG